MNKNKYKIFYLIFLLANKSICSFGFFDEFFDDDLSEEIRSIQADFNKNVESARLKMEKDINKAREEANKRKIIKNNLKLEFNQLEDGYEINLYLPENIEFKENLISPVFKKNKNTGEINNVYLNITTENLFSEIYIFENNFSFSGKTFLNKNINEKNNSFHSASSSMQSKSFSFIKAVNLEETKISFNKSKKIINFFIPFYENEKNISDEKIEVNFE